MGELWRWNGHRTRSGSRAPEHDHAWKLPAPTAPPGLGQADTVPRGLSARIGIVQPFTLLEFTVHPGVYDEVCLRPCFRYGQESIHVN
jgi:hypothetical protein